MKKKIVRFVKTYIVLKLLCLPSSLHMIIQDIILITLRFIQRKKEKEKIDQFKCSNNNNNRINKFNFENGWNLSNPYKKILLLNSQQFVGFQKQGMVPFVC